MMRFRFACTGCGWPPGCGGPPGDWAHPVRLDRASANGISFTARVFKIDPSLLVLDESSWLAGYLAPTTNYLRGLGYPIEA
jgi:hypothetical protein